MPQKVKEREAHRKKSDRGACKVLSREKGEGM